MDDQSKNHARFLILSHLIFVWKYRKKLLISYGMRWNSCLRKSLLAQIFLWDASRVAQDHMHCLVKSEPRISPLAIVRKLKQASTIQLWQRHEKELKKALLEGKDILEWWLFLLHHWKCKPTNHPPVYRKTRAKCGVHPRGWRPLGFLAAPVLKYISLHSCMPVM